jgi:hypothetical protein
MKPALPVTRMGVGSCMGPLYSIGDVFGTK